MATNPIEKHQDRVLIGSGELFVDLFDDAGNRSGLRYLGDSTAFSITVEETRTKVMSGDGPVAQDLIQPADRQVVFRHRDGAGHERGESGVAAVRGGAAGAD